MTPETGQVRISCSEIMATEVLPVVLADLRRVAPGVMVELSVSNMTEDIVQRAADIAIRMTRPVQAALVAQKVQTTMVGLFAVPGLVAAETDYATFQASGPFVGEDRDKIIASGFAAMGLALPEHVVFRSDSQPAQLAAVRAGVGAGVCQERVAQGLVRLCPEISFPLETWVVMHEDLRGFAPVRRVFDHLVAALR
ncbi:MAG: substrate-binding domain-containing protein [Paracoccaceae bacterium]